MIDITKLSPEQMVAYIAELQGTVAKLQVATEKKVNNGLKVNEKGSLSCYLGTRFPVTLYRDQWVKLLDKADEIRVFIEANKAKLPSKDEAKAAQAEQEQVAA